MAISGVAELTGRVLAGRYRLLAPIGAGASGRVYVADDVRLRRRVAVKVLHAALAEDAGFIRRFRAEARVAASLNHPNVMAVYDWGEDDVPFMVLELLTGGSLRSLLDSGARLTPSQATYVGGQVASALEYAHGRGVVHRDIKPANLLFDEHGTVRVADFGLARALAEASWTEPSGAVVGTARYAAPEQVSAAPLDGRADLYSLAVVLVEAVTGSVPDLGETAIGTLVARTRNPIVAPPEMGPLGPAMERAGRPDPGDRFADAVSLRSALADAARVLPAPEPLPLAGLGGELESSDPTQLTRSARLFDQDASSVPAPVLPTTRRRRRAEPRAQRAVPIVVATVVVLALTAGGLALAGVAGGTVAVPSLVGLTAERATELAADAGVALRMVQREADDPEGVVISQRPPPGAFVGEGGEVELVVSRGPPPIPVPDVTQLPPEQARALLERTGFAVHVAEQHDESVPAGAVIGTDPAIGQPARPDSLVKLLVSTGPAPIPVPDVATKTYEEASAGAPGRGLRRRPS